LLDFEQKSETSRDETQTVANKDILILFVLHFFKISAHIVHTCNGPMFDDCQHVRDALFSLVDQSQNGVLHLEEPRELKRIMKKDSFLKY